MRDALARIREEIRLLTARYGHGLHTAAGHALGDASRNVRTSVVDGALGRLVFRSGRHRSALAAPFVFHADFAGHFVQR